MNNGMKERFYNLSSEIMSDFLEIDLGLDSSKFNREEMENLIYQKDHNTTISYCLFLTTAITQSIYKESPYVKKEK